MLKVLPVLMETMVHKVLPVLMETMVHKVLLVFKSALLLQVQAGKVLKSLLLTM